MSSESEARLRGFEAGYAEGYIQAQADALNIILDAPDPMTALAQVASWARPGSTKAAADKAAL